MEQSVKKFLAASADLKSRLAQDSQTVGRISAAADLLIQTARRGNTIYSCGNGGSTCDALHLTEELVARYKRERPGIRAAHLCDPAILTCWSNDYSFDGVFERQIKTLGRAGDALVLISTSGNSKNILAAAKAAKEIGLATIALTGKSGGELSKVADVAIVVPANETERIQEVHLTIVHIWCELLETTLFP